MRKQYHCRLVGTDHHIWDIHRLVRLSSELPIETVPLNEVAELNENWWYSDEKSPPTPRSIAEHMALVAKTDLKHPIILCSEGRLMDGMHRLVKALLEDNKSIKAVRFIVTPEPDYLNVDLETLPYPDEEV